MEKRVLEAEEKVKKFPFFAQQTLTRLAKKWIGIKRQSLSAKLKSKPTKELEKQLEMYKQLQPANFGEEAMRRLQIFSTENPAKPSDKTTLESDRKIIKDFLASKMFEKGSKNIIETRRKRNREVRHLRERMGRKQKREVLKEEKKLNPKRAPLPSQKDMYLESLNNFERKQKPKNRLGQRERKRRALEREREEALRKKEAKPTNRKEKRKLMKEGLLPRPEKKVKTDSKEPKKELKDAHEHHASWALKRKREEDEKNAKFSGKKMTFGDSGGESDYDDDSD